MIYFYSGTVVFKRFFILVNVKRRWVRTVSASRAVFGTEKWSNFLLDKELHSGRFIIRIIGYYQTPTEKRKCKRRLHTISSTLFVLQTTGGRLAVAGVSEKDGWRRWSCIVENERWGVFLFVGNHGRKKKHVCVTLSPGGTRVMQW